jgi:hypothetical protein
LGEGFILALFHEGPHHSGVLLYLRGVTGNQRTRHPDRVAEKKSLV